MINIVSKNTKTYYFPIGKQSSSLQFTLKLYSELTLSEIELEVNTNGNSKQYFPIEITSKMLEQVPNGEYNYSMFDDENIRVSIGMIKVSIEGSKAEYNVDTDYIVYDAFGDGFLSTYEGGGEGCNLQDKTLEPELNEDRTYYPDAGYDGFKSVTVEGIKAISNDIIVTQNGHYTLYPREGYEFMPWANIHVEVSEGGCEEEIRRLENEISILEGEKNLLQTKLDFAENQLEEDAELIRTLNEEIADKTAQIQALNEQIQNLLSTVETQAEQLIALQAEKDALEAEKTALEARLNTITSTTITENGTYVPEAGVEGWNSVTVDIQTGDERIRELEARIAELNEQITNLNEEISNLNETISDKNAEIATLEGEKAALQSEINTLNDQISTLQGQVQNLSQEVSNLNGQVNVLTDRVSALEAEKTALQETVDSLRTSLEEVTEDRDHYRSELSAAERAVLNVTKNGTYEARFDYVLDAGPAAWGTVNVNVPTSTMTYVELTQSEYDELETKDNNIFYIITD